MSKFAYFSTGQLTGATHEFEIHAAGCSHLKQRKYSFVGKYDFVDSAHDTADAFVASEAEEMADRGWTAADFRIFPCARA